MEILTILIREGADVSKLTAAYPGLMSPVHVATKLALETGLCTCTRALKFTITSIRNNFTCAKLQVHTNN